MKNFRKMAILLLIGVAGVYSCAEGERFAISSDDTTAPAAPVFDTVHRLAGGGRIFYKLPADRDLLSIEASFTATNGKVIKSAASFLAPYLDVYGLPDTLEHTVQLYAVDMAGNKSASVPVKVKPEEPAFSKVAEKVVVKPAFGALVVDWENDLGHNVTVLVDFSFSENGTRRSLRQVYSSRAPVERYFINDLAAQVPIDVQIAVEDLYGNRKAVKDTTLTPLLDEPLDKSKWALPEPGVIIGTKVMGNGESWGHKTKDVCDGYIDYVSPTGSEGNCAYYDGGFLVNGVAVNTFPWQIFIDLGAKYKLSRIVTHQFWNATAGTGTSNPASPGNFYGNWNVMTYNMYWWDGADATIDAAINDVSGEWKLIRQVQIPTPPAAMATMDKIKQALAGDEALMFLDPDYTPATRFFRYEPVVDFANQARPNALSEITLYGIKAP